MCLHQPTEKTQLHFFYLPFLLNRAYKQDNLHKEALEGQQHHLAGGVVSDHEEVLGGMWFRKRFQTALRESLSKVCQKQK